MLRGSGCRVRHLAFEVIVLSPCPVVGAVGVGVGEVVAERGVAWVEVAREGLGFCVARRATASPTSLASRRTPNLGQGLLNAR